MVKPDAGLAKKAMDQAPSPDRPIQSMGFQERTSLPEGLRILPLHLPLEAVLDVGSVGRDDVHPDVFRGHAARQPLRVPGEAAFTDPYGLPVPVASRARMLDTTSAKPASGSRSRGNKAPSTARTICSRSTRKERSHAFSSSPVARTVTLDTRMSRPPSAPAAFSS